MATELEIMMHAREYLDKLANGINPLTNEKLPDSDVVNQVRISRCLFYVSDVLRQVIEKGGLQKSPRTPKIPFSLTDEQIGQFQLFDEPIFVSAITERLNSLIDNENMKKLSHRSVTAFLEREGFLESYTDDQGKNRRKPTAAGIELGITTELRRGIYGPYTVILYDRKAQQYLLDHLQEIAQMSPAAKNEKKAATAGPSETSEEEPAQADPEDD